MTNYRQIFARKAKIKQQWLKLNPNLNNDSGIYILTREENGFRYGYVGQAKQILDRLCDHSEGFNQHIDLSLKKHKLYSENNPTGWKVWIRNYPIEQLDQAEQYYIKYMANKGYQLRNKTSGSQGQGKTGIADNKPAKGYRDGVSYGKKKLARDLTTIIDKYLIVSAKDTSKRSQNALEKFWELLEEPKKEEINKGEEDANIQQD